MRLLLIPHLFKLCDVRRLLVAHLFELCNVLSLLLAHLFETANTLVSCTELLPKHGVVFLDALGDRALALYLHIHSAQVLVFDLNFGQAAHLVRLGDRTSDNKRRRHSFYLCGGRCSGSPLLGGLCGLGSTLLGGGGLLLLG